MPEKCRCAFKHIFMYFGIDFSLHNSFDYVQRYHADPRNNTRQNTFKLIVLKIIAINNLTYPPLMSKWLRLFLPIFRHLQFFLTWCSLWSLICSLNCIANHAPRCRSQMASSPYRLLEQVLCIILEFLHDGKYISYNHMTFQYIRESAVLSLPPQLGKKKMLVLNHRNSLRQISAFSRASSSSFRSST